MKGGEGKGGSRDWNVISGGALSGSVIFYSDGREEGEIGQLGR